MYVCFGAGRVGLQGEGESGVIVLFKKGRSAPAERDGIDGASPTLSALRMGGGGGVRGVRGVWLLNQPAHLSYPLGRRQRWC